MYRCPDTPLGIQEPLYPPDKDISEILIVFEDDDDTKDEESLDEYHEEDIDVEENVEVDDSEEFSHL